MVCIRLVDLGAFLCGFLTPGGFSKAALHRPAYWPFPGRGATDKASRRAFKEEAK